MKRVKKMMAFFVALVLTITLVPAVQTNAAPKMKLNKTKVTLFVGKTVKLKVRNKNGKKVQWKSTNNKVAKVTKKGKVTAKKQGKATIIAKVGNKKLKCRIIVKKKQSGQPVTTTKPVETTKPAVTTKPQVTEKPVETTQPATVAPQPTTKPQETTTKPEEPTTTVTFTTDASIEKPFGLVVDSPENGMPDRI